MSGQSAETTGVEPLAGCDRRFAEILKHFSRKPGDPLMHSFVVELLQCPACHGRLAWQIDRAEGEQVKTAEAQCRGCHATYPVREGIGIFLTPDLPRNDLWDASGEGLAAHLQAHPDVKQALLTTPFEQLSPADRFFRYMALVSLGRFAEARSIQRQAWTAIYTPEYDAAVQSQVAFLLNASRGHEGPIVDLASGRGILADGFLAASTNPIVLTDFNLRVLRENRRRLTAFGLADRVSLLAFDARRMPFRDGAVELMTTLFGLGNIEQPGDLLHEVRRVVSGHFRAIAFFCPEDDQANLDYLRRTGMDQMLLRREALQHFTAARWQVAVQGAVRARAEPTPTGQIISDAVIDGFPVAETELEFCVLDAK